MAKKQLTVLVAILAALLVVAVIVKSVRMGEVQSVDEGVGEHLVPDLDINEVSKITLESGDEELVLAKVGEEGEVKWSVESRDGYPANFDKIRELLIALSEVKISQWIEAGPSQFGRLQLIAPGDEGDAEGKGVLVSFSGEGEGDEMGSVLLGKEYVQRSDTPSPFGGLQSTPAGRYVRVGDDESVWLVSETFGGVGMGATDWLDTDFFEVENLKSIAISAKDPAFNWRLYRESPADTEWQLAGIEEGEELDAARISSMRNVFSNARFEDVMVDLEKIDGDVTKMVLQTFDGFVYTVEVGPEVDEARNHHLTMRVKGVIEEEREAPEGETEEEKTAADEAFGAEVERLKAKLAKEKRYEGKVYLVPNFVVSSLLKRRFELLKAEDDPAVPGGPGGPGGMPFPGGMSPQGFPPAGMPGSPIGRGPLLSPPPGPTSPTPAPAEPRATAVTPPVGIENGKIMSAEEIQKRAAEAQKKIDEAAGQGADTKKGEE
ncbi:MAG: DUF4340 domain-containing protein [Verrucomicrobiota bacterium]